MRRLEGIERRDYVKQYKYTNNGIKTLMKDIVVLVDTVEKQNSHILDYFTKNHITYERTALNYEDYSFYIPAVAAGKDIYFHRGIMIERKANLEELSGNLAQERERFEKEFLKAGNDGAKIYLMIEERGGYSSIIGHKYHTQLRPAAYMASLKAWEARFHIHIEHIQAREQKEDCPIKKCVILSIWENHRAKGGYPSFLGGCYQCPPDERKEGETYVCYISGTNPDRNIHCCSCRSLL